MDSGNELAGSKGGPWLCDFALTKETQLHPIFQHRPRMALGPSPLENHTSSTSRTSGAHTVHTPRTPEQTPQFRDERVTPEKYPQSIRHIYKNYGRYLKSGVMAHDAFYALHELFEFSAASIDQLLELLEDTIRGVPHQADAARLSELLILKANLDGYRSYVRDTFRTVQARGNPKWPRAVDPRHRLKADQAAIQLEARYEHLLARCDRLSEHASGNINILMSLGSQEQTAKTVQQTDRLGKLSFLAYFYVPISFAASFFSMGFVELENHLSIWAFFSLATLLLFLSMLAWVVDLSHIWTCCWVYARRKFVAL
ncbi:hypothetical protein AUP68_06180 [Ilyonectria robusta]